MTTARTISLNFYNEELHRFGSSRFQHPLEGLPGKLMARHTCEICGRKRYERDMNSRNLVAYNKFKAWLLWECKECKPRKKRM